MQLSIYSFFVYFCYGINSNVILFTILLTSFIVTLVHLKNCGFIVPVFSNFNEYLSINDVLSLSVDIDSKFFPSVPIPSIFTLM